MIPNTAPVITLADELESIFVNQTFTLNFDVTDPPLNSFTVSVENLPSFASFSDNGAGGSIEFNPIEDHIGEYSFAIRATDNQGLEKVESITFTVEEEQLFAVALNFNKNYAGASPWNNTGKNPAVNDTFSNLLDENGTATTVDVTLLTAFGGVYNDGATTGNNSGVVPDNVLKEYYYWGIFGAPNVAELKVSGLDFNNKYTFKFVGSSIWSGAADNGETNYTIGNKTVSVDVQANTQNMGVIEDVTADLNGEVIISMTKGNGASVGYINALIIESYAGDPTIFDPSYPKSFV